MRVLVAVLVALLAAPALVAGYAADLDYPRSRESLVEGHSVFTTVEARFCYAWDGTVGPCASAPPPDPYTPGASGAWAKDGETPFELPRRTGVAWFNDQNLAPAWSDPDRRSTAVAVLARDLTYGPSGERGAWRYPCGGWVVATAAGNPDPRDAVVWFGSRYVETYRIEDPLGYVWTIDRYTPTADTSADLHVEGAYAGVPPVGPLDFWVVPVLGIDATDPGPSSALSCAPFEDGALHDAFPYGDARDDTTRRYNALVVLPFADLRTTGAVAFGADGPHDGAVAGCQVRTEWECPSGAGDAGEGNSHAYDPRYVGTGATHAHATADVDVYFTNHPPPFRPDDWSRKWRLYDVQGADAPYHERRLHDVEPPWLSDPTVLAPTPGVDGHETGYVREAWDEPVWEDACASPWLHGHRSWCVELGTAATSRAFAVRGLSPTGAVAFRACTYAFTGNLTTCVDGASLAFEIPPETAAVAVTPFGRNATAVAFTAEWKAT